MTIYSAVLIGYQRVTDRRTDVQTISITCFSIADARKNRQEVSLVYYIGYTAMLLTALIGLVTVTFDLFVSK